MHVRQNDMVRIKSSGLNLSCVGRDDMICDEVFSAPHEATIMVMVVIGAA